MVSWHENPENDLREIELHREANEAWFGADDDREQDPYDEEWSEDE